jgi:Glycosyltransferases involved in cell wall biogenesis
MLFSIIIPVYNVEQYLRECLDSVLAQSFSDYEVICVNDGSTDGSLSILEEYAKKDNRFVVVNQQNKGQGAARNVALKLAKGGYVFFLDSDDWLAPNALEILAKAVSDEDVLCFNGQLYYEDRKVFEVPDKLLIKPYKSGIEYCNENLLQHRMFAFACVVLRLYRRDFLIGKELFFHEGIYHEDDLFSTVVCYYAGKVNVVSDVLYYYRIREGSTMTSRNVKKSRNVITVANELVAFFEGKEIERASLNRYIAGLYFRSFMPENKMPEYEKELIGMVDWERCGEVCTYPRHKRMYRFLRISPKALRLYVNVEQAVKSLVK